MKHINRRIMQYQVIVLDLDGTLTNSKKEITEPTRQALIDIQKNGKTVVFCQRPPHQRGCSTGKATASSGFRRLYAFL